ncbi:hypothetical protein ACEQPO_21705 [Bacillus sp. SL00103]
MIGHQRGKDTKSLRREFRNASSEGYRKNICLDETSR